MLRQISNFWLRHIHPRFAPLIATIGIVGLASCLLILFVLVNERLLGNETALHSPTPHSLLNCSPLN